MAMLWQRFTERAKRVVIAAQAEAAQAGEPYVHPEHLLLGLVNEDDSVAIKVLERLGVPAEIVQRELQSLMTDRGGRTLGNNDVSLDPRMKRVLDFAYEEARQLHTDYIGTEHLLLGVIREGDGIAFRTLTRLGVDLVEARNEVVRYIGKADAPEKDAAAASAAATAARAQPQTTKRVDHQVEKFNDPEKARAWLNKVVNEGYEVSKVTSHGGEIWIIASATVLVTAASANTEPNPPIPQDHPSDPSSTKGTNEHEGKAS